MNVDEEDEPDKVTIEQAEVPPGEIDPMMK